MWDGIKKALNSRLGTNTFKPLDVLIDEVKAVVDAIRTNTNTNNTASTTGTLSQKISSAIDNTATNNSASATGILSQKLSWIGNSLIGATSNTGGDASSGTVMAKLNAILKKSNYKISVKYITFGQYMGGASSATILTLNNIILHSITADSNANDYNEYAYCKVNIDDFVLTYGSSNRTTSMCWDTLWDDYTNSSLFKVNSDTDKYSDNELLNIFVQKLVVTGYWLRMSGGKIKVVYTQL